MSYQKNRLLGEGKTKKIWSVDHQGENLVIIEAKDDITAFDDPKLTEKFGTKSVCSTATTCRVFELLQKAGILVAYKKQISPTEFLAHQCSMIPLEVIARRFAVGSFLKRHPELTFEEGQAPHRFHRLVTELFLKTTGGQLIFCGKTLVEGLSSEKGEEDPFIKDQYANCWQLFHPKKPSWMPEANLGKSIDASFIVGREVDSKVRELENILRDVFLVLEGAWNTLGLHFIDIKIEFGFYDSNIFVADVIDNDSWRLQDIDWNELSKQAFRDGAPLDEVEEKYKTVASLVEGFRIPKQAFVLWRGSSEDEFPKVDMPKGDCNVDLIRVTLSGHKQPTMCLNRLEAILGDYPDGGVIVAKVGRSNGLGPMLAARTSWPVIAIPATIKSNPEDVWSSIRMPSFVPLNIVWPEENAVLSALNILAGKNPLLYMYRQRQIEELDT